MAPLRPLISLVFLLLPLSLRAAVLTPRELDRIPLHVLSPEALDAVRAVQPPPAKHRPPSLALSVPMSLGLEDGVWSERGDVAVWRARVSSVGATLILVAFDRFDLPPGAQLRIQDPSGITVQGPYTHADRTPDGGLWTAMVPGEEALIELQVPVAERDAVDLRLGSLGHGVLGLRREGVVEPRASSSCNIDVVCPQGNDWRDQIRSVVSLQIPSGGLNGAVSLCSGQLVNTTAQDDRPYILTANHCGVRAGNAANVVAYFNFQTTSCGGTPNGSLTQTRSGATHLFSHSGSDHTLLRLNSAPPKNYNVYLSGFDASATAVPTSGIALHHPAAAEKRISVFDSAASKQSVCLESSGLPGVGCLTGTMVSAFRVFWSQGVTEPGSSGGGLWNQSQRLVGVLSGGSSSCTNPGGEDNFGRLHVAWDAGLGGLLDPAGTGARAFCGANPGTDCLGGGTPTPPATPTTPSSVTSSGSGGAGGGAFGGGVLLLLLGLVRCLKRADQSRSLSQRP